MKRFFPAIAIIFLVASCKDSPILIGGGMHKDGQKNTLFTIETIYTVTSKKSGGGMTTRSGYTTSYLNAIDVNTGESLKRKKIGDFRDRIEFIASLGGKAWFFSYDPAIGLHTRNPETLEVGVSVKDIIAKNPSLSGGLSEQAYQSGIDTAGKNIFATSKDGYSYLVDPVTLVATKTDQKVGRPTSSSNDIAGSSRMEVNDSLEFSFEGSPRSSLKVTTEKFNQKSYQFFSHNGQPPSTKNLYYDRAEEKKYPDIDFIDPKIILDPMGKLSFGRDSRPLNDGNAYFMISKSVVGNQYNWVIAALHIDYTSAKLLWKFTVDNSEKLSDSDKELLSADIAGDKLVLVFENAMVALNRTTGTVVWRKDIRTGSD